MSVTAPAPSVEAKQPTNRWLVLVIACLAQFMVILDATVVNVALPSIQRGLHFSAANLQWVVNGYTLFFGGFLLLGGRAADLLGRKRLFVVTVVAFGITSLLCGLAPSTPVLIVGRFLQGLSGGAMLICQIAILSHQFREPAARGRAFGVWGIVFGLGLGFGPIIGGWLAAAGLGGPQAFYVFAGVALLGALVTLVVPHQRGLEEAEQQVEELAGQHAPVPAEHGTSGARG